MEFCDISLLIIAGGKSVRMGQDKRWLSIDGMGMLERLCVKASRVDFAERFLCVDAVTEPMQDLAERYGFHILTDAQPGEGPMSGLSQGLAAAKTEYALAVAGDMPFFTFPPMRSLLEAAERHPEWEVVMPAAGGRHQPLAALYRKSFAVRAWEALQQGERRPRLVMARVPHGLVNFPDDVPFFNVNTPADFRIACGRMANLLRDLPVITVSAPVSNTGKTTFIERLIPMLATYGIRAGVVKGDCHGYDVDEQGKDSWRFREAGAEAVAVVSPNGYFLQQRTDYRAGLLSVAGLMRDVDLVFIESRAHGVMPVLQLWRGMGDAVLMEDTAAVFASPLSREWTEGKQVHAYPLADYDKAVQLILFLTGLEKRAQAQR